MGKLDNNKPYGKKTVGELTQEDKNHKISLLNNQLSTLHNIIRRYEYDKNIVSHARELAKELALKRYEFEKD